MSYALYYRCRNCGKTFMDVCCGTREKLLEAIVALSQEDSVVIGDSHFYRHSTHACSTDETGFADISHLGKKT